VTCHRTGMTAGTLTARDCSPALDPGRIAVMGGV
jgi:hypothetical protein